MIDEVSAMHNPTVDLLSRYAVNLLVHVQAKYEQ